MAVIALISIFLIPTAVSMKPSSEYGYNECELIAKDFQKEFGGSLVFVQPLKVDGSYDLCDYCGHWINKKYISGNKQEFFFDWGHNKIYRSKQEIISLFRDNLSIDVEIFELDKERPPFAIIWHF